MFHWSSCCLAHPTTKLCTPQVWHVSCLPDSLRQLIVREVVGQISKTFLLIPEYLSKIFLSDGLSGGDGLPLNEGAVNVSKTLVHAEAVSGLCLVLC